MIKKLLKSKSARFIDFTRGLTVGNVVFIIVIALVLTYLINFFLNQFFGFRILPIGQPLRFLVIGIAVVSAFYIISRKQGVLERQDVFTMLLIVGASFALFYYLPVLVPEIFQNNSFLNSIYTNPNSPVLYWYNASVSVHNTVQSVIPIP